MNQVNNILTTDFELADNPINEESYAVNLKTGKYKNISYMYGKVDIKENMDEGVATLKFNYQLIDCGSFDKLSLEKDEQFMTYIGDILAFILTENLTIGTGKIGHINTTTDAHTEPSD
jgi:hypothetical protein